MMQISRVNQSFLFLLFFSLFSIDATSLTIKIVPKEESLSILKPSVSVQQLTLFQYLPIVVDGHNLKKLSSGAGPQTLDDVIIELEGRKMELPWKTSRRLLNLLSFGWKPIISNITVSYENSFLGAVPSCSFIMLYLAFGMRDFTSKSNQILLKDLKVRTLHDAISRAGLQPGTVVIISNLENRLDKEGVIYLGDNVFLTWNRANNGEFYFRRTEHLDSDLPKKVQFLQASGEVKPLESKPKQEEFVWYIKKEIYDKLKMKYPGIFHNSPSYIN
ncbi:hypothetical protein NX722_12670 [Endozoicomonas gorgoniicola]|uniref:Uncharacterized protein n=1 Tax=Endozoicomonas gorgoniicola TaxID=1234144 RepID=A0ABT3MVS6_9GAMM|nr:hypothetical protein [Endozoicomonas gorgoniicola]MCW7553474.1 hypothetical protein [Endozoicomonas gorgoniicola]